MCVFIYMYIHTYVYPHICAHACICTHTCICAHINICTHTYMHIVILHMRLVPSDNKLTQEIDIREVCWGICKTWRSRAEKRYSGLSRASWVILARAQKAKCLQEGSKQWRRRWFYMGMRNPLGTGPETIHVTFWYKTCLHFVHALRRCRRMGSKVMC